MPLKNLSLDDLPKRERATLSDLESRIGHAGGRDFVAEFRAESEARRKVMDAIGGSEEEPTFLNTIHPLEVVDERCERVLSDYGALLGVNRCPELEAQEDEMRKLCSEEEERDLLDDRVAKRVRALRRKLTSERRFNSEVGRGKLIEEYYQGYHYSGFYLCRGKRKILAKENTKMAELEMEFTKRLSRENKYVFFGRRERLDGLGAKEIEEARAAAKAAGRKGWAVKLDPTVHQGITARLKSERARKAIAKAVQNRGKGLEPLTLKIARARLRVAKLSGFRSWGQMKMSDSAAMKPERVWGVFKKVLPRVRRLALADIRLAEKAGWDRKTMGEHSLWEHLPSARTAPTFRPYKVLEEGCFRAAGRLFGLRFERVEGIRLYHPDVRVYRARIGGRTLGFLTTDFWRRRGKDDGGWASTWDDTDSGGRIPSVSICCNFTRNGFCDMGGVLTIFHEFGHVLHALFTARLSPSHVGLKTTNDFVETPSQLAEYWAYDKSIYRLFAEPNSPSHRQIVSTLSAGTGLHYLGSIISSAADLLWHGADAGRFRSCLGVDKRAMRLVAKGAGPVVPRYKSSYFGHIFGDGYDASYYSYLWCELSAGRIHRWVKSKGGLNRKTGTALRRHIYGAGGDVSEPGERGPWHSDEVSLFFETALKPEALDPED